MHPLYADDIMEWPHDVTAANELLDQAGYLDGDGDGIRQDPATELPFHVTLGINLGNEMRQQVAQMFQDNMADCGIEVELFPQPAADWFAPEGALFGRRFDLAQFPWITNMSPACHLYTTAQIPSKETGWVGNNETGWSDASFDAACGLALDSLVGTEGYRSGHQEALRIFSGQVPVIPLFSHLKLAVTRPRVQNFRLDPSQDSEMWNIFEIDLSP
jgi:peptide/nickel transport system substrate-binding protein